MKGQRRNNIEHPWVAGLYPASISNKETLPTSTARKMVMAAMESFMFLVVAHNKKRDVGSYT